MSGAVRANAYTLNTPQNIDSILEGTAGFADRQALVFVNRLLEKTSPSSAFASRLCLSAERNMHIPGFPANPPAPEEKKKKGDDKKAFYDKKNGHYPKVQPEDWETLKTYFAKALEEAPEGPPDAIYENLGKLADHLKLGDVGRDVLQLINIFEHAWPYQEFIFGAVETIGQMPAVVSRLMDQEKNIGEISAMLGPAGPLMTYGLIYRSDGDILPETDGALWTALAYPGMDAKDMVKSLLGTPCSSDLTLDDFSYLGEDLYSMVRLLKAAVERGEKGINVILYGPAGNGKTELTKAIAAYLGKSLYAVGENESFKPEGDTTDDMDRPVVNISGGAPERSSAVRMAQLQRAQALLKGSDEAVLLFDEVEDLLIKGTDSSKSADVDSKIGINRMLENNPVVTIWTGNDPEKFHEAVRQRFAYSLYVGVQPTLVREKIWKRQLALQKVELPAQDVLELARKYNAPPRMVTKAVRVAALSGGGREAIEQFLAVDSRLALGHREAAVNDFRIPEGYDPKLAVSSPADQTKVDELTSLSRARTPFSLLVTGEKGTGSSYLLNYIGEQAVQNVGEVSMAELAQPSPMISPEQKIQQVFSSAANERALLVFHDIEFLSDNPGGRTAHWDTSLAATFVAAARRHSLPFAVTTQSDMEIPEAFRSEFSHQLSLQSFTAPQAQEAYGIFFGHSAPATLDQLGGLVIEDFEAVRRRAGQYAGEGITDDTTLISLLAQQKQLRLDNRRAGTVFTFS